MPTNELIIKALPKEISSIISFINIVHNMKEDQLLLKYNDGRSALVIPKGYFKNINMKRTGCAGPDEVPEYGPPIPSDIQRVEF